MSLIWPMALAVMSDVIYQVGAKSIPGKLNPFASLTITYLIGSLVSTVLYVVTSGKHDLIAEWKNINWATFALGLAIVGLEAGSIYMYKVGWNLNTGYIIKSMIIAVALIVIGCTFYREAFSVTKAVGVVLCLGGLVLINK